MESNKAGPEEGAEWQEHSLSHQHACSAIHQITCWYTVIARSKEELEATDMKTQKLFTMLGQFHSKYRTLRL